MIEVGKGVPCGRGSTGCETRVPFRVGLVDGGQLRFEVFVVRLPATEAMPRRVGALSLHPDQTLALPSEGGPPIGVADISVWLFAAGIGLVLVITGEGLMRLARHRRSG